jgi:hypothetical protein
LLAAKQNGLIPAARPVPDELRQAGMYLPDPLVNRVFTLMGQPRGNAVGRKARQSPRVRA